MGYVEHGMWEILDVLERTRRGESQRTIARATGLSRNTVRKYVALAEASGWDREAGQAPTEELAAKVSVQLKPGRSGASPGDSERRLLEHKKQIKEWLEGNGDHRRGLTLVKIHVLLGRQGVDVSYGSLYRFVVRHLDFGKARATVRVEDVEPGELAEIDFGRLGYIWDPDTEKQRLVHALVVTLVHSRHQYVHLTYRQRIRDVIEGLEDAWEFFGGVPRRVVLDNMRSAVAKADRYAPAFQRTFGEYAAHRGFVIDAAVVRHPTGKPHVERQMQYVRENFFKGEDFKFGLEQAQLEAVRWCLGPAGNRIHGTTRKRPLEVFKAIEKEHLQPLDKKRFDPPDWKEVLIHPDFHVRYDYALYSVPYKERGPTKAERRVTIRADSKMVRIYKHGRLIKTHPRLERGQRSTDPSDYPDHKAPYAMRDIEGLIDKARRRGPAIAEFVSRLLSGTVPWSHLRQAQKLMRLADKYGNDITDAACRRALAYEVTKVRQVQNIIEKGIDKMAREDLPVNDGLAGQQTLTFLRDSRSFVHPQCTQGED